MDILPTLLDSDLLHTISLTLLHFLWQGALFAGLLYCIKHLTSNKHSQLRYYFSLFCLLLCAVSPAITYAVLAQKSPTTDVTNRALIHSDTITTALQTNTYSSTFSINEYTPLIAVLWIIGVVFLSLKLFLQMWQVHKLTTQNIVAPSDKLQTIFNQLKEQLGGVHRSKLVISLSTQVPMAIGWIKPVVLLPANLASGLTIAQLEMLMAHELAHIKRYDYLVNLLQTFVEVVLFFHPCVRWISKQIRIEREYCCDDIAVHHCGNQLVYARALAEAEQMRENIPELAMAATGGELTSRVHRVVGQHSCAPKYGNQWLAAIAAMFVIPSILTASKVIAMTQTPEVNSINLENDTLMVLDANIKTSSSSTNAIKEQPAPTNSAPVDKAVRSAKSEVQTTQVNSEVTHAISLASPIEPIPITEFKKVPIHKVNTKAAAKLLKDNIQLTQSDKISSVSMASAVKEEVNQTVVVAQEPENAKIDAKSFDLSEAKVATKTKQVAVATTKKEEKIVKPSTPINSIKEATVAKRAKLLSSVLPEYPRVLYSNSKRKDEVLVSFTINQQGLVEDIQYQENVRKGFKRNITRALKQWRFEPAMMNGKPVKSESSKVFSFSEPSKYLRPVTGSRLASRIR